MFSRFFAIVFGYVVLNSKINDAKGSNATSPTSTVRVPSTTTTLQAERSQTSSSSVAATISPTPSTIGPQATQTITPTQPPFPTAPPYKRTYVLTVTLANYPWKEEYNNSLMAFVPMILNPFLEEMKALFKNGSFPDLRRVEAVPSSFPPINDSGRVRTKFQATFRAVPSKGSKEPEMYFRLKNFEKGSKYKYYVVSSSIKVEENVQGVTFGNWTLKGEIPEACCGEKVVQTRTCKGISAGSCAGLHLNHTFPCQLMYPVVCGKDRKFTFNITLEKVWKDEYKDSSSSEYKDLVKELTTEEKSFLEEVKNIFKSSRTGFKEVDSDTFKLSQNNGKVGVSFTLLFNEPPSQPEDPEALFRFKTENGKIGSFGIDTKSIKIEESVSGYTFTPWTNKASECDTCCGGPIQQTRTCETKLGACPNAQLTRSIRCKHVCLEVKCGDSSKTVPYVLGILICILASSFFW